MKWILILIVGLAMGACSKRLDQPLPTAPFYQNNNAGSASSVRLLHLSVTGDYEYIAGAGTQAGSSLDVSINDKKLTNFLVSSAGFTGGTVWFPAGTFKYGNFYTIPDSLFDPKGDGDVKLFYNYIKRSPPIDAGYNGDLLDSTVLKMDLHLHNNPNQPQDVILYDAWQGIGGNPNSPDTRMQELTTIRSQAPSRPDHFLIRLINLAGKPGSDPQNQLTLTYADGSVVDGKTTAVSYPAASDYIELPYGTYQFKVRDGAGNLLAEADNGLYTGPDGKILNSPLTYNSIRTYNPGGVYTIVVHWSSFMDNPSYSPNHYLPGCTIVTDVAPSTQPNYIRVQGVQAVPGLSNIHFAIDGQPLGGFLKFGEQTGYSIFSIGPHKIQLLDGNGAELVSRMLDNTYPLDNLSVWAYAVNGQPQLLITSNDMSQTFFVGTELLTGTVPNSPQSSQFSWQCRFLNLSADIPYVSFIDSVGFETYVNSGNVPQAWEHLGIGVTFVNQGVVSEFGYTDPAGASITAYNSPPGELPGTSLGLVLHHPMVANPQLYAPGDVPPAEQGTFSIALIGSANGTGNSLQLIRIKHNQ